MDIEVEKDWFLLRFIYKNIFIEEKIKNILIITPPPFLMEFPHPHTIVQKQAQDFRKLVPKEFQ